MTTKNLDYTIYYECNCIGLEIANDIFIEGVLYSPAEDLITCRKAGELRAKCSNDESSCSYEYTGSTMYYPLGDNTQTPVEISVTLYLFSHIYIYAEITVPGIEKPFVGGNSTFIFWKPHYWTDEQWISYINNAGEEIPCVPIVSGPNTQLPYIPFTQNEIGGEIFPDVICEKDCDPNETLSLFLSKNMDICKNIFETENLIEKQASTNSEEYTYISFPAKVCENNECGWSINPQKTGNVPIKKNIEWPWKKDGYIDDSQYVENEVNSKIYEHFLKPFYFWNDFGYTDGLTGLDVGRQSDRYAPIINADGDLCSGFWKIKESENYWETNPICSKDYVIGITGICKKKDGEEYVADYFFSFSPGDVHPTTGKVLSGPLTQADFPIVLELDIPEIDNSDQDHFITLYAGGKTEIKQLWEMDTNAGDSIKMSDGTIVDYYSVMLKCTESIPTPAEYCTNIAGVAGLQDIEMKCYDGNNNTPTVSLAQKMPEWLPFLSDTVSGECNAGGYTGHIEWGVLPTGEYKHRYDGGCIGPGDVNFNRYNTLYVNNGQDSNSIAIIKNDIYNFAHSRHIAAGWASQATTQTCEQATARIGEMEKYTTIQGNGWDSFFVRYNAGGCPNDAYGGYNNLTLMKKTTCLLAILPFTA